MKQNLFLFGFTLICNTLAAQTSKNDWQNLSLKDKPQTIIINNGIGKLKTIIFNESGYIIQKINEHTCYSDENTIDFIYSHDNKLIEKTTTINGQTIEKIKYLYDSEGNKTEKFIIGEEISMAVISDYISGQEEIDSFDINGNLTKKIIRYPEGFDNQTKIIENRYKYDNRNNWVQMEVFIKEKDENTLKKKESISREIKYF